MLIDSIMFCIDLVRETREGLLVFFSSSLKILNWFKSPCNSSSGFSWFNLVFSWLNSGFVSSYWFVSFLSWDSSLVFVIVLGNLYLQYQIFPISIDFQFFLILYFILKSIKTMK